MRAAPALHKFDWRNHRFRVSLTLAAPFLAYKAFHLDFDAPTVYLFRHGAPQASDHKTRQRAKRRGMLSHPAPGAVSNDARRLVGKKRGAEQFEAIKESGEAPPVAEQASRFRGSAPLVATNGSEKRLAQR